MATRQSTVARGGVQRSRSRRKWIDMGNGVRMREPTKAEKIVTRLHQRQERRIEESIERDTLGLGYWREPEGWGKEPFSHTVTVVTEYGEGWSIYNSGVVVALVVHPEDEVFTRGEPYVWCRTIRNRNGTPGTWPTAPVFGRFIEKTPEGHPKALVGLGRSMVLGPEYDQCFRAVGRASSEFFPRSEIPIPVPSEAVRIEQPLAFECLQESVKALTAALGAMANVTDLIGELDDADKDNPNADRYRSARKAQAYDALDHLLTETMRKASDVREAVAYHLKVSPELAYWLERRKRENLAVAT